MKKMMVAASAVLTGLVFSAPAISAETKVAMCEYCNSQAFRNTAEVIALQESPRLNEGVQFVFVVDIGTDEIRYYEVVREYIETCLSSTEANSTMSSGSIIDPDNPPDFPDCFSSWVTTSTQLAPPAGQLAEIRGALEEVDKFLAEIQDMEARDMDFGSIFPIDSATDLIGPDGTAPNNYNVSARQQTFMNAVSNAMLDSFWERAYWDAQSAASAAAEKYLGERAEVIVVTVNFENGTEISVKLINLVRDENGSVAGFEMEIQPGSALHADGLTPLPESAGDFSDQFGTPFFTTPPLARALMDLFVRAGGRVVPGPSTNDCSRGTVMCWDNPDGTRECQPSYPDPQLGC